MRMRNVPWDGEADCSRGIKIEISCISLLYPKQVLGWPHVRGPSCRGVRVPKPLGLQPGWFEGVPTPRGGKLAVSVV